MNINVELKQKFRIGDKEYHSIEEMPGDVCDTFEKAIGSQKGSGYVIKHTSTRSKFLF
jgi:hypothetical protein